jgi:carbon-monoxide dehydrogenase large subunit
MPGVKAVFVGEDMAAENIGGIPCGWQIHKRTARPWRSRRTPSSRLGKVRHVGDPVAVVVAETRAQARDSAEAIVVEYDPLPAVATMDAALAPGAPQMHDGRAGQPLLRWHIGDKAALDAAFAGAKHVCGSRRRTTGWCRTRWSRARPSASSTRRAGTTRSTPPARTRTSSAC